MEDVPHHQIHQCFVLHTSQILQVAMLLLLTLGCAALHAGCSTRLFKNPLKDQVTHQSRAHARRSVVHQAVHVYLNTWALFLVFLAALFLAPVEIPAYLGLNAAWLCFLNSLLIAVVLCVVHPASQLDQGLAAVPPDSFCEWRFRFSSAAEEKTWLHRANTQRTHVRGSEVSCWDMNVAHKGKNGKEKLCVFLALLTLWMAVQLFWNQQLAWNLEEGLRRVNPPDFGYLMTFHLMPLPSVNISQQLKGRQRKRQKFRYRNSCYPGSEDKLDCSSLIFYLPPQLSWHLWLQVKCVSTY